MLPSQAARVLDHDPERIDILATALLGYASAKRTYDAADGDDEKMKLSGDTAAMVRKNSFLIHKERLTHKRYHGEKKDLDGCHYCQAEFYGG